jgi:hypothetical protein
MKRSLYFDIVKHINHKNALVITGMRQVGKTTLMKMIYNEVEYPKIWFDFDNPLDIMPFEAVDYNQIYYHLGQLSNQKENEPLLVCIDEIQNFPEITKIIKYLIDHYNVKFIVTGSSNYYMRNLFPESLSGRKFLYELKPLSFKEFLYFKGVVSENEIRNTETIPVLEKKTEYEFHKNIHFYNEFVEYGGFPEVALTPDVETKNLVLRNIFASFFEKDIKVFTELKDVRELRDLMLLLAPRSGNILDITKLSSDLGVNRAKVYNYIEFLQSIFFLKLIPKYSKSIDRSVAAGKKLYFSDTGILNTISKVTEGQLFETAVCNQLQNYGSLSYFNKRNVSEIDFILNQQMAIEVKTNGTQKDADKLQKTAQSIGIEQTVIISRKYCSLENVIYPQFI